MEDMGVGGKGTRRRLPIGNDDFRKIRENGLYYVDKTMMVKDFIETQGEVALITRPRRFGKTLNMTMIRDFFDITQDSRDIFSGLAIMGTAYASQINSRPVIYLSFKDCKEMTAQDLLIRIKRNLSHEYSKYEELLRDKLDTGSYIIKNFYKMIDLLNDMGSSYVHCSTAILWLTQFAKHVYGVAPILLIDEYDQPIMSSYEHGYRTEVGSFFSNLYGSAMKGNQSLGQALLTGVQRVAKESIFSQFNNVRVYTVMSKAYSRYFGLTGPETRDLLADYGLKLDERVKAKYDGYLFGGVHVYNPWSILNYADTGVMHNYWVKTSTNYLIKELLKNADGRFLKRFDVLAAGEGALVALTLETAYIEHGNNYSLWGLLVNAGYLTIVEEVEENMVVVKIPNAEVMSEFQMMVAELAGVDAVDLRQMFRYLLNKEIDKFVAIYRDIVISCTSYMDAKENAYHMLFLGMCMALRDTHRVKSNVEAGDGRPDIVMESISPFYSHVIIELKQGAEKELDRLKEEALRQILDNKYYAGLKGEVICIGVAHDKKHCQIAHRVLNVNSVPQLEMGGQESADNG